MRALLSFGFVAVVLGFAACSDDETTDSSAGSGAATGAGASQTGGSSADGGTGGSSTTSAGGAGTGGAETGGAGTGGAETGGAEAGGAGGGLGEGAICGQSAGGAECNDGLVCCYPCGIPDCDFLCTVPCTPNQPGCGPDGCALVP